MTKLRTGKAVTVGDLKIVTVEAVCWDQYSRKEGFCATAFKGPAFVVVVSHSETRAFDLSGAPVDLQDLPRDCRV